jgi:hypothetical protein
LELIDLLIDDAILRVFFSRPQTPPALFHHSSLRTTHHKNLLAALLPLSYPIALPVVYH